MKRSRPWIRVSIGVAIAAAVGLAAFLLPIAEWTVSLAEYARGQGVAGAVLFFAAYMVSTVALLPGSILTLAGSPRSKTQEKLSGRPFGSLVAAALMVMVWV